MSASSSSICSVDDTHWLSDARRLPSPNGDARPDPADIALVVIHGIALPPGQFGGPWIDDLFLGRLDPGAHPYFAGIVGPGRRVSAHCCIFRDGALTQYLPFNRRAWHAGASEWRGRAHCNDFSIGIELEGGDDLPYAAVQYERLLRVLQALIAHYPRLSPATLAGHSDVAPGRKTDPGPAFDWALLRRRLEPLR